MVSVNLRGWTWLDEDKAPDPDSPRGKAVQARADALMEEWSRIRHEEEQHGFELSYREERGDYFDPRNCDCDEGRYEDPDELCVHDRKYLDEYEAGEAVKREGKRLRMELIEAELQGLGIRKMRAYESWQEDEAYMQYMEEGRFGHYTD